jgi:uncharacterized protein YndB with AHSA1/START domain
MAAEVLTIEEGPDRIRLVAHYEAKNRAEVYRDWTEPDRLRSWWGPEAAVDLRPGGEYVFRWRKIDATLRGKYSLIEPDSRLEFTWAWDDAPESQTKVSLRFTSDGGAGSWLEVTQGPYRPEPQDQELRQQHLEGWRFHLPKIAGPSLHPT